MYELLCVEFCLRSVFLEVFILSGVIVDFSLL